MTDDICGYEGTTTGEPCRHPAGSCPVDSHSTGAGGRPSTFTDELAQQAITAAEKGKSESGIEREVGVGHRTIFGDDGWVDQDLTFTDNGGETREFSSAIRRARARGEDDWVAEGRGEDGDTSFAKFMLSTSYGYVKTEKREVSGEGGGPVEISINESIVETPYGEDA